MRTLLALLLVAGWVEGQTVSQPNWYSQVQAGNQTGVARIGQTNAFFVKVYPGSEVARPIVSAHLSHSAVLPGLKLWNGWGDKLWMNLVQDGLFVESTLRGNQGVLRGWGNMRVVPRGTSAPMTVTLPWEPRLIGSGFYVQALGWEWFQKQGMWSCQFTTLPQYVRIQA